MGKQHLRMPIQRRRTSESSPWTYALLDERQREVAAGIAQGKEGWLFLSEVSPVITFGKRATPESSLLVPSENLLRKGITLYSTDRGGLATYHGPGQWVLFIIDSVEKLTGHRRGVRRAVELLLGIGLEVCMKFDTNVHLREGPETGLWTNKGKLGSVGIQVKEGILLHGLSLNVFSTSASFYGIKPCGLDCQVSYLIDSRPETDPQVFFEEVGNLIVDSTSRF